MSDWYQTPECVIHMVDNKSGPDRCVTCGAEKRWTVPVSIDYEAAIERARTYLSHHASYEEQIRQAVDAVLGGNDGTDTG